jgi:hypothetical protein
MLQPAGTAIVAAMQSIFRDIFEIDHDIKIQSRMGFGGVKKSKIRVKI